MLLRPKIVNGNVIGHEVQQQAYASLGEFCSRTGETGRAAEMCIDNVPPDRVGRADVVLRAEVGQRVLGRFAVDAWIRSRTVYALTNRRALLLRRVAGEKLLTSQLGAAVLERGRNGAGTLRFGRLPGGWMHQVNFFTGRRGMGWDIWTPALNDRVEFLAIDDVMTPYQLAGADTAAP